MKNWIRNIALVICLAVFAWASWELYSIWHDEHQIETEITELAPVVQEDDKTYLRPDWEKLKAQNPDIVCWIYLPGTDINFPVVQGPDNNYYLNRTFKGETNKRGAIFLDSDTPDDFTADNSIIFGHSVDVGGMFTGLADFENEEFFDSHPYLYVLTPDGNYKCPIWTFAKTLQFTEYFRSSFGDFTDETLEAMAGNAMYVREMDVKGKKLVSLSTCDLDYGYNSNNRLVLTAVLEQTDEPIVLEGA